MTAADLVRIDPNEAKAFDIRRFAVSVQENVDLIEDVDRLRELDAVLAGCRVRLQQLGESVAEAERARILVYRRIGVLLGEPVTGRPKTSLAENESETSVDSNVSSEPIAAGERKFRHLARLLAEHPEAVDEATRKSRPSLTLASNLAKQARAHERAASAAADMSTAVERIDVQTGQWWALGDHRLYCGDSRDAAFVEACRSAEPTFAFADPPYNVDKAEWDNDFVWAHDYLTDLAPVVAVTPGNGPAILEFLRSTSMPFRWLLAAYITNGMTRGALGFANWIPVALFAHTDTLYREAQDVIKVSVDPSTTSESAHASRKPTKLLAALLDLFTSTEDTVIDPFLGSGTTLVVADKMGRRCVGAEIDPLHCGDIVARYGKGAQPL
jgi:hypothetical protein